MVVWRLGVPVPTVADGASTIDAAATPVATVTVAPALHAGGRLGRYVLLHAIGHGGMGVVYAAYDPELARRVALKVLHPTDVAAMGSTRARLLREARSLARLTHPNVVPVFDVGEAQDCAFVAMEFVEGATLAVWLRAAPRSPQAIAACFADAGRGLVAAHALGVVHRDFKPDNVIVGIDGRARVVDFGIARAHGADPPTSLDGADASVPVAADTELTRAGTVLGTPAYMAPEQHRGHPPTPAADQYSFCVALFEALFGRRPFAGADATALLAAKLHGAPAIPTDTGVPRWLQRLVLRGLAPDPATRWPSMVVVVERLDRGPRRRRWWPAAALAGAAIVVAAVPDRGAPDCSGAGRVAAIWSPARATAIAARFDATGLGYAAQTWTRAAAGLDRFATQWQVEHDAACTASVRGDATTGLDARMQCLDARLDAFGALVDVLADIDATGVARSVFAVADLTPPETCREATAAVSPTSPEQREQAAALRRRLARAGALEGAGRIDAALDEARSILQAATVLDHPPLVAEARYVYGSALERSGDYERARVELGEALWAALAADADATVARAGIDLLWIEGVSDPHPERADEWARHVRAALARSPDAQLEAQLANATGAIHAAAGRPAAARADFERALAAFEQVEVSPSPNVATALQNLGIALTDEGRLELAREHLARALDLFEETEGPSHPDVADVLDAQGGVSLRLGDLDAARQQFHRALVIRRAALGDDHPMLGRSLNSLGTLYEATGDLAAAEQAYRDGLAVFERALGEHGLVGANLVNLANLLERTGRADEAATLSTRALEILDRTVASDHPWIVNAEAALGRAELRRGHLDAAGRWLDRAAPRCGDDPALCGTITAARARLSARTGVGDWAALARTARAALLRAGPLAAGDLHDLDAWLATASPSRSRPG